MARSRHPRQDDPRMPPAWPVWHAPHRDEEPVRLVLSCPGTSGTPRPPGASRMRSARPSAARRAARLALPAAALVGLTGLVAPTTAAAAPPLTANCDTTVGDPSISSFLSPAEVQRRLAQIERTSKGLVEVDVVGTT